jgi:hypothetical protein
MDLIQIIQRILSEVSPRSKIERAQVVGAEWRRYGEHFGKLAAEEGLSASGADSSRGRSRSGNRRDESSQGSPLTFDKLREFEPIRFGLECTLRAG